MLSKINLIVGLWNTLIKIKEKIGVKGIIQGIFIICFILKVFGSIRRGIGFINLNSKPWPGKALTQPGICNPAVIFIWSEVLKFSL